MFVKREFMSSLGSDRQTRKGLFYRDFFQIFTCAIRTVSVNSDAVE
jgi:hypothetical protein